MKKLISIVTLSACLSCLLVFVSCQEDPPEVEDEFGILSLSLEKSISIIETKGRANAIVPVEDFIVEIYDESAVLIESYETYSVVPPEIELPIGNYTVVAHSNNEAAAEFENPYYYGEEAFTVLLGETSSVSLVCELANVKVSVEYSENITSDFQAYQTTVSNSTGDQLIFNESETRAGYFAVDPLSITAQLTYVEVDGDVNELEFTGSIPDPQPKTHYTIVVDAIFQNGRATINITLDDSTNDEVINIGNTNLDVDGDGFTVGDGDCDDTDPSIYPGAAEIANDGLDQDCDGFDLVEDADGDGFSISDGDCDDNDSSVYPGATEIPNDGVDQDCDGSDLVDDVDGDGVSIGDGDCNDNDSSIYPGATEIPYDGIDQNCDGSDLTDVDGDGVPFPTDCDDTNPSIRPGAPEIPYDGIDQNCDGSDLTDVDGDGVSFPADCDDTNPTIRPGAPEIPYDGIDQNCDGMDLTDVDGDGVSFPADCDDTNPTIRPGAPEIPYDGIDQNCDGMDLTDVDGDGFNFPFDCDDNNFFVNPGANEIIGNGIDDDCDGFIDIIP